MIISNDDEWYCSAVYEGGLYLIQAGVETFIVLLLIFYGKGVYSYVLSKKLFANCCLRSHPHPYPLLDYENVQFHPMNEMM